MLGMPIDKKNNASSLIFKIFDSAEIFVSDKAQTGKRGWRFLTLAARSLEVI